MDENSDGGRNLGRIEEGREREGERCGNQGMDENYNKILDIISNFEIRLKFINLGNIKLMKLNI